MYVPYVYIYICRVFGQSRDVLINHSILITTDDVRLCRHDLYVQITAPTLPGKTVVGFVFTGSIRMCDKSAYTYVCMYVHVQIHTYMCMNSEF